MTEEKTLDTLYHVFISAVVALAVVLKARNLSLKTATIWIVLGIISGAIIADLDHAIVYILYRPSVIIDIFSGKTSEFLKGLYLISFGGNDRLSIGAYYLLNHGLFVTLILVFFCLLLPKVAAIKYVLLGHIFSDVFMTVFSVIYDPFENKQYVVTTNFKWTEFLMIVLAVNIILILRRKTKP